VRWETERSFDGKLCQKYSYLNYQNLIIGFQVTVENVGDVFGGHGVVTILRKCVVVCVAADTEAAG